MSAYIVRVDTGFAPNPFGRHCTLACCKPTIRRKAQEGDIIVGTGSVSYGASGRLIYAMRVRDILSFQQYWESPKFGYKLPSSGTAVRKRGDNIWHQDPNGNWQVVSGALHDEHHRERDLRGKNVLIASEFYYFGRAAIPISSRFHSVLARTQGHRNTYAQHLIDQFWNWLEDEAPKRGRIDYPFAFTDYGCQSQCQDFEEDDIEEDRKA